MSTQAQIWLLLDSRGFGGIESHVLQLGVALREAGWNARAVLLDDHGPHPLDRQTGLLPVQRLAGGWRGLDRALRREPPTLLHTHGYKAGIYGRLLARLHDIPVLSTFHAGETGKGRLRLYQALDRATSTLAPRLAVSAAIAARLPGGAMVLDNFVGLPPPPRLAPGRHIAFVGRLCAEKGPDRFIELARRLPGAQFDVYGDGPLRDSLEAAAPANLRLYGACTDMPSRWRHIGLLCLPSREEGLPMAALEAMAHGVPVAAFAVGGLPGLTPQQCGGYLLPAGDMQAMTDALSHWLTLGEDARRCRGLAAWQRIEEAYCVQRRLLELLTLYRHCLGDSPCLA